MTSGQIVLLNGAPRSGKSSIAAAVQEALEGVWMNLGVDRFMAMTPPSVLPGMGLRPGGERPDLEPVVGRLWAAFYDSVAAHSRHGVNVVADVGHHDHYATPLNPLVDGAHRLMGLPVVFVGVRCPLEAILERRRATGYLTSAPGEPPPAPVVRWQEAVHRPGDYDLEVDTSVQSPEECAEAIRAFLAGGATATAFARLRAFSG